MSLHRDQLLFVWLFSLIKCSCTKEKNKKYLTLRSGLERHLEPSEMNTETVPALSGTLRRLGSSWCGSPQPGWYKQEPLGSSVTLHCFTKKKK